MNQDELAIVGQFNEARTPQELARVLRNPTPSEAKALSAFLGEAKFFRLRALAFSVGETRNVTSTATDRNVVILPGIMGSELDVTSGSETYNLWLNLRRIGWEGLNRLELDSSGTTPTDSDVSVSAPGLLSKYYGETMLTLGQSWNVRAFPYDWRADLETEAAALHKFIRTQFGGQPVSLVAHSMGGLVARALWRLKPMADDNATPLLKRLIMLGTPNKGSFEVPLILAGIEETVKKLIWLTHPILGAFHHDAARDKLLSVLSSFPAIYQMLPREGTGWSAVTKAALYTPVNAYVRQAHLDRGIAFLDSLKTAIDPERMFYIAGYGFETIVGLDPALPVDRLSSYWASDAGDGRVPHDLGRLDGVQPYFVKVKHGELPASGLVLRAVNELLDKGQTAVLPKEIPAERGALDLKRRPKRRDESEDEFGADLRAWAEQVQSTRGLESRQVDPQESRLADAIVQAWIADPTSSQAPDRSVGGVESGLHGDPGTTLRPGERPQLATKEVTLKIRLVAGNIATCHTDPRNVPSDKDHWPAIDTIAVGMYQNQRKAWAAIFEIDKSIDPELANAQHKGLLSDLIERGLVRGDLAMPTLIPDPRRDDHGPLSGRHFALVGMGLAGQFGATEAGQTAVQLAWYLSHIGKKHLATILIGAGQGNLPPYLAMRETLNGFATALNEIHHELEHDDRLQVVTFVEFYEDRIRDMHNAILSCRKEFAGKFAIRLEYEDLTEKELRQADENGVRRLSEEARSRIAKRALEGSTNEIGMVQPTRIVSEQLQDSFWFSAMTDSASIPERQVEIDPKLVALQNTEVVAASDSFAQEKEGLVLGRLLIPRDFRRLFASSAPVVLDVDTNTARISWELIVHDNPDLTVQSSVGDPQFLALKRGFTRQLRTRYAPPPESLPAPGRVLRALVVADPASDAHLEGAQREGIEVVQIFRAFNQVATGGSRIDVTDLIGPSAATRVRVLGELLSGKYDILHYSGHCFYDDRSPLTCGWLFQKGATLADREVLAARELRRVDRMPSFIFSNACESGVMPFRPEERSSGVVAAFAETFFERGVNNLICTGWPVNDRAARLFARVFYGQMLGLDIDLDANGIVVSAGTPPSSMAQAMMAARAAVRTSPGGIRTWGAYQHYGNPLTQFFIDSNKQVSVTQGDRPKPSDEQTTDSALPPENEQETQTEKATVGGTQNPPPPKPANDRFAKVRKVIEKNRDQLRAKTGGVVDIRPGYRFEKDWITDDPAIIVVLSDPSKAPEGTFPKQLDGIAVDVTMADPLEQLAAASSHRSADLTPVGRQFLTPGEEPGSEDERTLTPYVPPPGSSLAEINEEMSLTCHVSPDCGFPVLSDFLDGVTKSLTVSMYDFTAPHVRDRVKAAVRPKTRTMQLVLDPQLALDDGGSDDNPKSNDVSEDTIVDGLRQALGSRFDFAWAAVTNKGKVHDGIFPKAYHIKVAVRDKSAFWLSSGNWQSSNQPPLDVVPRELDASIELKTILGKYNREWHTVIANDNLAKTFETFISWDLQKAKPLQGGADRGFDMANLPELLVPVEEEEDRALVPAVRLVRHKPAIFHEKLKVQPVLTPDNYPEVVEKLIRSAKSSIRFQNQYINIGKTLPDGFKKLLDALKAKCEDPKIKVRIILRDIGDVRKMLDGLKAYGFPAQNANMFRLQKSTHTKGIVVDDARVLVGSHNWSGPGTTANRDASLLFDSAKVAKYYADIFDHDWEFLAKAKALGLKTMPRVADATRDAETPSHFIRMPWSTYFEDCDDM